MLTQEDLQEIDDLMDKKLNVKLAPINDRLSGMEASLEEIRSATCFLLNWAERVKTQNRECV